LALYRYSLEIFTLLNVSFVATVGNCGARSATVSRQVQRLTFVARPVGNNGPVTSVVYILQAELCYGGAPRSTCWHGNCGSSWITAAVLLSAAGFIFRPSASSRDLVIPNSWL